MSEEKDKVKAEGKKKKKSQHHRAFLVFPKVVTRLVVSRMEGVFSLFFHFFFSFTFSLFTFLLFFFLTSFSPLAIPFHSSANHIGIRGVNIIIIIIRLKSK